VTIRPEGRTASKVEPRTCSTGKLPAGAAYETTAAETAQGTRANSAAANTERISFIVSLD
jgi:hypothetical protein